MPTETKHTKAKFRVVRIPSAVTVHVEVKGETAAVFYFEKGSEDEAVLKASKAKWFGPDLLEALLDILLKADRQQAANGDKMDFQDSLRECGNIARAALSKAA
jgi:hypothetical protein